MTELQESWRIFWTSLSRLDVAALSVVLLGSAVLLLSRALRLGIPAGFIEYLAALASIYLLFRLLAWSRTKLLWSLRNRLIVAYLFMALVPVVLLLALAFLAGQILYSQLGAYLIYDDIQHRLEMLSDSAAHVAAAESAFPVSMPQAVLDEALEAQEHIAHDRELPGLRLNFHADPALLHRLAGAGAVTFTGIVQEGEQLKLVAVRTAKSPRGISLVELSVAFSPEFLENVAADLGPIQVRVVQRVESPSSGDTVRIGDAEYRAMGRIVTRRRRLQAANFWIDPEIEGFSKLEATYLSPNGVTIANHPVFAFFSARPMQLNHHIFSSLGELSRGNIVYFQIVAVVLLIIWIGASITGFVLARAITRAVAELYRATQYVQAGDFTYRVRIERRDQLGVLGESFNLMTSSIRTYIEDQELRRKLENEISIAREVQAQLFPQAIPNVPGVEIEAICRAARVVSGDYYDFIQLSPTHVALVIADISGKGISAALLMASLQAALRSAMLAPGSAELSTAELVSRLNQHLVRNTGDDRFATLFLAIYDSSRRLLRYTNAGHLPGLCVCNGTVTHLDVGGMVLGVVADYHYEEGAHVVAPGTLLIGYSDGLIEPENVYGEQFGIPRLAEAALRRQGSSPSVVAESLMMAAEEWAGTAEQADDMTVIVARLE